jgi:hypothetical protein
VGVPDFFGVSRHFIGLFGLSHTGFGIERTSGPAGHSCVERAKEELSGQMMFYAWHMPYMPPDFRHWRDKYIHRDDEKL